MPSREFMLSVSLASHYIMEVREMEKKVTVTCRTRRFEGDGETVTELTLDFSDLSEEDIFNMAADSAVIKWQAAARRAALKKDGAVAIPTQATYIVPKPGTRATGEVSAEKAVKTILRKAGGDAAKALELMREMMEAAAGKAE